MLTAKEVCRLEAEMLIRLLNNITPRERGSFITKVTKLAGLPRRNWYNWQYAHSRIPMHAKTIIEEQAQCHVFDYIEE